MRKPHIMLYFKEIQITSIEDLNDPQLEKVLEFKKKSTNRPLNLCPGPESW
jgi:hypothetical protein